MKNLRLIAGLVITTAFFVGCAVSTEPGEKSIRIDNATVTHQGDVSVISNGDITVSTSSLTLTQQFDSAPAGVCCTDCNIFTGQCSECHTCIESDM